MTRDTTRNRPDRDRRDGSFADRLDTIKTEGGVLLVVGAVGETLSRQFTRVSMGDPSELRRRLLVFTEPTQSRQSAWLPGEFSTDGPFVNVISRTGTYRSAASAASQPSGPRPSLASLLSDVETAVGDIHDQGSTPGAGEIRVGVYSLAPLVRAEGLEPVVSFVADLSVLADRFDAVIYLHYPVPATDSRIERLSSQVDGVVTLIGGEQSLHRWQIGDIETPPTPVPGSVSADGNRDNVER